MLFILDAATLVDTTCSIYIYIIYVCVCVFVFGLPKINLYILNKQKAILVNPIATV